MNATPNNNPAGTAAQDAAEPNSDEQNVDNLRAQIAVCAKEITSETRKIFRKVHKTQAQFRKLFKGAQHETSRVSGVLNRIKRELQSLALSSQEANYAAPLRVFLNATNHLERQLPQVKPDMAELKKHLTEANALTTLLKSSENQALFEAHMIKPSLEILEEHVSSANSIFEDLEARADAILAFGRTISQVPRM